MKALRKRYESVTRRAWYSQAIWLTESCSWYMMSLQLVMVKHCIGGEDVGQAGQRFGQRVNDLTGRRVDGSAGQRVSGSTGRRVNGVRPFRGSSNRQSAPFGSRTARREAGGGGRRRRRRTEANGRRRNGQRAWKIVSQDHMMLSYLVKP